MSCDTAERAVFPDRSEFQTEANALRYPDEVEQSHSSPPAADRNRRILLVFLAAAVILGAVRWQVRAPASGLISVSERKTLLPMHLDLVDGTQWALGDQKGKIVLINYWATWCAPCQEEMPALNRIAAEQAHAGVEVLGISLEAGEGGPERVREFVKRFGVTYPIALGPATLASAADTIGIPNTLLVDRSGRLAKVYAGPIRASDVADDLRTLSREP